MLIVKAVFNLLVKVSYSSHARCGCCEGRHKVSAILEKDGEGVDIHSELQSIIDTLDDGQKVRISFEVERN